MNDDPLSSKNIPLRQNNIKGQIFLFDLIESGNVHCLEIISFEKEHPIGMEYMGGRYHAIEEDLKDNQGTDLIQYVCSKKR